MNLAAAVATVAAVLVACSAAHAVTDGTLLSAKACAPNPIRDYADYLKSERAFLDEEHDLAIGEGKRPPKISDARLRAALATPATVRRHLAYEGFECRAITYASGGLAIAGYLWKPTETAGRKRPLVIINRGGNAHFGAMEPWREWGWHDFLKAGYVVLASQYRGGPGSAGEDEMGGRDIDDVRALVPLADSLGYVDTNRTFVFGGSRGGMESYMLARSGVRLRAMAIRAGVADQFRAAEDRPAYGKVLAVRIPRYSIDRDAELARRSAARWTGDLRVPTILFQGAADWRISPLDSLDVAGGLARAGVPVELHLYEGDDHAITLNHLEMIARTLEFFSKHDLRTTREPLRRRAVIPPRTLGREAS